MRAARASAGSPRRQAISWGNGLAYNPLDLFNPFAPLLAAGAGLSAVVGSMSAYYHDSTNVHDPEHRNIFAHRILAKLPTIAAAAYKLNIGQPFMYPRNDLPYADDFLHMLFARAYDNRAFVGAGRDDVARTASVEKLLDRERRRAKEGPTRRPDGSPTACTPRPPSSTRAVSVSGSFDQ